MSPSEPTPSYEMALANVIGEVLLAHEENRRYDYNVLLDLEAARAVLAWLRSEGPTAEVARIIRSHEGHVSQGLDCVRDMLSEMRSAGLLPKEPA